MSAISEPDPRLSSPLPAYPVLRINRAGVLRDPVFFVFASEIPGAKPWHPQLRTSLPATTHLVVERTPASGGLSCSRRKRGLRGEKHVRARRAGQRDDC